MGLIFDQFAVQFAARRVNNADCLAVSDLPPDKKKSLLDNIGIKTRYLCGESENAQTLAEQALSSLLQKTKRAPDFLLTVTQTSPHRFPHLGAFLHRRLGAHFPDDSVRAIGGFDLNLGCSGFVYAYIILMSMARSQLTRAPFLVCVDTYTKFLSNPRGAAYLLFSDAAVAVSFRPSENTRLLAWDFGTDGNGAEKLILKHGDQAEMFMDGAAVMLFTMSVVIGSVRRVMKKASLSIGDIDFFVFHQASKLVLSQLQRKLKIPDDKMAVDFADYGNTVSCTVPIVLAGLMSKQKIKARQKILLCGFGVGLSWATCLIEV